MKIIFKSLIVCSLLLLGFNNFADDNKTIPAISVFEGMLKSEYSKDYEPLFFNDEQKAYRLTDPIRLPVLKVAPHYPSKAARKNKTGIALVGYRVLPNGSVTDVEVIEEVPHGVGFGKAGVKAAKKFKYEALKKADETQDDVTYTLNRFTFSLEPGGGTEKELNKLIDKANSADPKSMYEMATVAAGTYRIKLDTAKENELILGSAMLYYHPAQLNIGLRLFSGYGMKKDRQKSKNWLELSAANGNEFAKKFLEKYSSSFSQTSDQIPGDPASGPVVQISSEDEIPVSE